MIASRLINSEMPCANKSAKPMKISDLAGHCGRPPALADCSLMRAEARKKGREVTSMMTHRGKRNTECPRTSTRLRTRLG